MGLSLAQFRMIGLEITLRVPPSVDRVVLFGPAERHLKMIRESLGVSVAARDGSVKLAGEESPLAAARAVVETLIGRARRGAPMSREELLVEIAEASGRASRGAIPPAMSGDVVEPTDWSSGLDVYASGRQISARSANQAAYLRAIQENDLVFGIGPAGTGKTYLAVAAAIHMLKTGRVRRAILARPAVEAGEKLGFLPGDQFAKVNPYLRPLLDALDDMMDYATLSRFLATDVVEVVPLAYMRGRTLNDAVILLDEAQNTTRGQMQMFLTRMGQRSKVVVTGDMTQIDLPDPTDSGLVDAARRFRRIQGIGFCTLDKTDVVRHPLVQRVIEAYESDRPSIADVVETDTPRMSDGVGVDSQGEQGNG